MCALYFFRSFNLVAHTLHISVDDAVGGGVGALLADLVDSCRSCVRCVVVGLSMAPAPCGAVGDTVRGAAGVSERSAAKM